MRKCIDCANGQNGYDRAEISVIGHIIGSFTQFAYLKAFVNFTKIYQYWHHCVSNDTESRKLFVIYL